MRYKFGREAVHYITNLPCDDLIRDTDRNFALLPDVQILNALRFLTSGSFIQVFGETFGVDKSTVLRVVRDVCLAPLSLNETCLFVGHQTKKKKQ